MIRQLALAAAIVAAPVKADTAAPLFASNAPLAIEIRAPIGSLSRSRGDRSERAAILKVGGVAHAVLLKPRGITRLRADTCQFPPLRVDFVPPAGANSPFAGQNKLKLVTHCRNAESFQQYVLLEYAAYRIYNLLTPASFRVRLATIDYAEPDGRGQLSRIGFFLEDHEDIAKRLAWVAPRVGERVPLDWIEPRSAARFALFNYMIGNLDWALQAGPKGEVCCHNGRLLAQPGAPLGPGSLVAVPYDFDFSGMVDAPYAVPPAGIRLPSVRERLYRGYCRHNGAVLIEAAEFRAKRASIMGELANTPGLDAHSRGKASAYLDGFFQQIATDQSLSQKILSHCLR